MFTLPSCFKPLGALLGGVLAIGGLLLAPTPTSAQQPGVSPDGLWQAMETGQLPGRETNPLTAHLWFYGAYHLDRPALHRTLGQAPPESLVPVWRSPLAGMGSNGARRSVTRI